MQSEWVECTNLFDPKRTFPFRHIFLRVPQSELCQWDILREPTLERFPSFKAHVFFRGPPFSVGFPLVFSWFCLKATPKNGHPPKKGRAPPLHLLEPRASELQPRPHCPRGQVTRQTREAALSAGRLTIPKAVAYFAPPPRLASLSASRGGFWSPRAPTGGARV